nr:hypothetical protein DA06_14770 [Georgenia sp. SUBG003]
MGGAVPRGRPWPALFGARSARRGTSLVVRLRLLGQQREPELESGPSQLRLVGDDEIPPRGTWRSPG